MRRDRIRNSFALGFALILLGAALTAMLGGRHEPADFTFANGTEPESLDPAKVTGVPEGRVLRGLFEGLTVQAADSCEPLPGMAESWTLSADGRTYTFRIRSGAKWSDGSPVTAEDFRWSWQRFLTPSFGAKYAEILHHIRGAKDFNEGRATDFSEVGVRVAGPRTLIVVLDAPTPFFLNLLAFYPTFPVHRPTVEAHPDDWSKPGYFVSNGPFTLGVRAIRDRIRLVKNPHYWDAANVRLKTIDVLPIEDLTTMINLYLTGVCDWITDVPPHVIDEVAGRDDFRNAPYLGVYFYRINQRNKEPTKRRFLGDRRVRRALYLALDLQVICDDVMRAGERPARSVVPRVPEFAAYQGPLLPGRDPEEARRLLAEALADLGLAEAPSFSILYNTHESHKAIAEVVQAQWQRELGLRVKLENMEWQSYLKTESSFDYDLTRAGWIGDYPDPNTFLDLWITNGGNNRTGFSNAEFDRLIAEAARTVDPAARLRVLARAEQVLLEEQVVLPIYYYTTKNLVRPWVKGFHANAQNVHNLKYIWIDEEARARHLDG